MANVDRPLGFIPVAHRFGGQVRTNEYIATTSSTIFINDPVEIANTGTVSISAASMDATGLGVSADWLTSSSAGDIIHVYDDPGLIYMVQSTTGQTPAAADIFNTADMITYAAGNTTTGLSIMELSTLGTSTGDFMLLGLFDAPDNAWGEHAKLLVIMNQHLFKTVHAGL